MNTEYSPTKEHAKQLAQLISHGDMEGSKLLKLKGEFKALFTKKEYCETVEKGKDYVKKGGVFQVGLSN